VSEGDGTGNAKQFEFALPCAHYLVLLARLVATVSIQPFYCTTFLTIGSVFMKKPKSTIQCNSGTIGQNDNPTESPCQYKGPNDFLIQLCVGILSDAVSIDNSKEGCLKTTHVIIKLPLRESAPPKHIWKERAREGKRTE
jgi:hypothetical protein